MGHKNKTVLYIGNILSKHGFTPTNIETLTPQLSEDFDVIKVSDKKNKILRLLDICKAIIFNKSKIDLILIDTYSTSAFKFAQIAGELSHKFNIPYIAILHGGNLPQKIEKANAKEKAFFTNAAALVAPSNYLYASFEKFGFKNLVYIPNNIDLSLYPFKERRQLEPHLYWVRSFHEIYNPVMAIDVLNILTQKYPNATLTMVGPDKDGTEALVKARAAELNLQNSLTVTGRLSRAEWHKLAESKDIFINTTNVDNTPISVVEAMALGLPIVSTNVGGLPYLLSNNVDASLVNPKDPQLMADAIIELLDNPDKVTAQTKAGYNKVKAFDWSVVKKQWFNLINEKAK